MGSSKILSRLGENWHQRATVIIMLLLGASLAFKDQYSTIVMILLLALGLALFVFKRPKFSKARLKLLIWIPLLLILPRILGLFYGEFDNATKELVRSIPLLVLPLAFVLIGLQANNKKIYKALYVGALAGIVLFTLICYYPVITTMIEKDQPLSYLLRWRYMNFNFTQPFDAHPAYIGLLVIWLIAQTFFSDLVKPKWRIWIVLGLLIVLFQLVARNALLVAFVLIAIYVIKSKMKWLQIAAISVAVGLTAAVIFHPSTYLEDKLFYIFKADNEQVQDKRFTRLEASFQVFKQHPIFGPGPGTDNKLRTQTYLEMGETIAYEKNYNAHNQFVEFLSTYGIVGASCFVLALLLAFRLSVRDKNWVDVILLSALVIAMLTESLLERSLGVKYLSLVIALVLFNHLIKSRESSLLDGSGS
ncbi:MAG: O-antigen ligase family protein [Gilvibacter sp.]